MDFFLENLILLVLIIIQSIFGIGLLLLGTPTFLLLGHDFSSTLNFLLPSSIVISYLQFVSLKIPSKKIIFEYRNILCDVYRPGHFDGVTTVVNSLFNLIKPDHVFFGEKDFQQLKIIEKIIEKKHSSILIHSCPSIRMLNGMSYSSRYIKFSIIEKKTFDSVANLLTFMAWAGIIINFLLIVVNLLPLPPLDGSRVLFSVLPNKLAYQYIKLEKYGLLILVVLLLTGILAKTIGPIIAVFQTLMHALII